MNVDTPLLELVKVTKTFPTEGGEAQVLRDIDLAVGDHEIVVLLGRSGCGKSTLLRIVAGLTPATRGSVYYRGRPVKEPHAGIAMVFQTFALFPWLNVLQNVELGLEARGLSPSECRRRALAAIDLIGLDGFESAYPKELSGGMRQRVGFARALVVEPQLLLMDEAFSALDVPTAETLRNDLLDLWIEHQIPTRAIIMVSHNIEEAVQLADRIVVLGSNPGRVKAELAVDLRHPRDRDGRAFRQMVERVYQAMVAPPGAAAQRAADIGHRLPSAQVQQMLGVLEQLDRADAAHGVELSALARALHMEVDDLFPVLEALELLDFARTEGQRAYMSAHGKAFVEADILGRKVIFGEHLLQRVPLAAHIRRVLDQRVQGRAPKSRFLRELEDFFTEDEAQRVLDVIVDWGRYAEIFAFDTHAGTFSLENPR